MNHSGSRVEHHCQYNGSDLTADCDHFQTRGWALFESSLDGRRKSAVKEFSDVEAMCQSKEECKAGRGLVNTGLSCEMAFGSGHFQKVFLQWDCCLDDETDGR
eukprot:TRINITY_DN67534_c6_g2_i1.p3 TRINITY_DN67534_c6_g2~~TRINITY_DN67534_c6_g2_i1.p3  ORF type:complete len:103 (-),score=3.32 TRINITY_DN67534_c6_g2_i1:344-652(-)